MKSKLIFLGTIIMTFSAGCSNLDFSRPVVGAIDDIGEKGRPYIENNEADEALLRAKQMARILAEWKTTTDEGRDYHIGPEDALAMGILSLEQPGKITDLIRTVQTDGTINLPFRIGFIKVDGLTPKEAAAHILKELKGRFIKEPAVTVAVSEYRSVPVVITGAVNKPGMYYLKKDRRSILELLAEADGLSTAAGEELLLVRGGGNEFGASQEETSNSVHRLMSINLDDLINAGDLRLNLWVGKGDMINVLPRSKEYIYVLGYVQRPGGFEMNGSDKVGALQAVAMAGGLASAGRAENSFLLRRTEKGQSVIPLDLTKLARGSRPTVFLEPGDTLVVGSSLLARLSEFVRPTVGAGLNYAPVTP